MKENEVFKIQLNSTVNDISENINKIYINLINKEVKYGGISKFCLDKKVSIHTARRRKNNKMSDYDRKLISNINSVIRDLPKLDYSVKIDINGKIYDWFKDEDKVRVFVAEMLKSKPLINKDIAELFNVTRVTIGLLKNNKAMSNGYFISMFTVLSLIQKDGNEVTLLITKAKQS